LEASVGGSEERAEERLLSQSSRRGVTLAVKSSAVVPNSAEMYFMRSAIAGAGRLMTGRSPDDGPVRRGEEMALRQAG
jgi:hypothetical protein